MTTYSITTPIYYINDYPHLGTAYSTILCDVLARFHRACGEDVFFLTGTDENGEKIIRAAEAAGVSPRDFVDRMSEEYKKAWQTLNISYDRFIRSTEEDHVRAVQAMFSKLKETGDIYKDHYEGWYCVPDETFILEAPDGKCPECGRPVDRVRRDAYFFALSRYGDRLLELYDRRPDMIQPESRRNEVIRFVQDGLRDMCVTRDNNGWGIPVPGDPDHVVYVWFDALVNYIAAAGYPDDHAAMERHWPAALHVVGKDILVRFHATLWPAMLLGVGQAVPRQILAHGFLTINEHRMRKSLIEQQLQHWRQDPDAALKVTGLRPSDLVRSLQEAAGIPAEKARIAVDGLRYFLMRDVPAGSDAEFSPDRLAERYNADLANDLGNLLNRTLSMLQRYRSGVTPGATADWPQPELLDAVGAATRAYAAQRPDEAIAAAWQLVTAGNRLIDATKPWILFKEGRQQELDKVLYECGESCRIAAVLIAPAMPSAAREILRQLGLTDLDLAVAWSQTSWGLWKPGTVVLAPEPIFPRIESKKPKAASASTVPDHQPKPETVLTPPAPAASPAAPADSEIITYEDFARVRLRVATIKQAERIEGARKLLKLTLDLGNEERQIAAGIAEFYEPEALVGRQIAVVVNLAPRTIRGIESRGMLLAADTDGRAILLQPDSPVAPGSRIR